MKIIIPARLGSKGLPLKNRTLFEHTAKTIPENLISSVIVTTDDPIISVQAKDYGFTVIRRPDELAEDNTSVRDVLMHVINSIHTKPEELIVTLYLTYPQRTWEDIESAINFFLEYYHRGLTDSLLCKKEAPVHPYLCLCEHGVDGIFGRQLVTHDLYRRQDYPKVFEISHFISIFIAGKTYNLNSNLYCDTTVFYPISNTIDVDTQKELDQFNEH